MTDSNDASLRHGDDHKGKKAQEAALYNIAAPAKTLCDWQCDCWASGQPALFLRTHLRVAPKPLKFRISMFLGELG